MAWLCEDKNHIRDEHSRSVHAQWEGFVVRMGMFLLNPFNLGGFYCQPANGTLRWLSAYLKNLFFCFLHIFIYI